jgi:hypothetical protein
MTTYHGTSAEGASSILSDGIDISRSCKGYFGIGFYTTPDAELARCNYAEFSGDEDGGKVLAFEVSPDARILDLSRSEDWDTYQSHTYGGRSVADLVALDGFDQIMRSFGVDGIADRSFGGIVFYNPNVLAPVELP